MYKLAIFDLDGTLLDTIEDLAVACNRALRLGGFDEHPCEAYKSFVGNGMHNLVTRALPPQHRDSGTVESTKARFSEYYGAHAQDATRPYDGIVEALTGLQRAGVKVAVLSNKPDRYTGILVERYFPGLVDLAYGQREGVPIKPDPTAVREIMGRFGYGPEECIYIGDSGTDMETGGNAGLDTIGVLWGFRTKSELESHGATITIDKAAGLLEIIVDNKR